MSFSEHMRCHRMQSFISINVGTYFSGHGGSDRYIVYHTPISKKYTYDMFLINHEKKMENLQVK